MIHLKKILPLLFITDFNSFSQTSKKSFVKENNAHYFDSKASKDANVTEEKFHDLLDSIEAFYQPIFSLHGAQLIVNRNWESSKVNAFAWKTGFDWHIDMIGGLARRGEVTPDGFLMVACHEIGHHIAGFPFYPGMQSSSEGQSDYFAAQSCLKNIWKNEESTNKKSRKTVHFEAKKKCNQIYNTTEEQNLCYRISMAGRSVAILISNLDLDTELPEFNTPNLFEVEDSIEFHPDAQCRLDTFFNGALCKTHFLLETIPENELEANENSCSRRNGIRIGNKPRCWYSPSEKLSYQHTQILDFNGNEDGTIDPGETIKLLGDIKSTFLNSIPGGWIKIESNDVSTYNFTSDFGGISPKGTINQNDPFLFKVPEEHPCGKKINIHYVVETQNTKDSGNFDLTTGNIRQFISGSMPKEFILKPHTKNESTISLSTENKTNQMAIRIKLTHQKVGTLKLKLKTPDGRITYLGNLNLSEEESPLKKTYIKPINPKNHSGDFILQLENIEGHKLYQPILKDWQLKLYKSFCTE